MFMAQRQGRMSTLLGLLVACCLHIALSQDPREKCAIDFGCFDNCNSACDFLIYWTESGTDVTYHLSSTMVGPDTWMMFAMTDNTDMDNDYVLGCKGNTTGNVHLLTGLIDNGSFSEIADPEVTLTSGTVEGAYISCSIQRPTAADNTTMRKNSTMKWTYVFDKGLVDATDQSLTTNSFADRYLSTQPLSSSDKTVYDNGMANNTLTLVSPDPQCGVTKGCFSQCESPTACSFQVSWIQSGSDVTYHLSTPLSGTTSWVLLAMSEDNHMGDDYVMGCSQTENSNFITFTGVNPNDTNPTKYIEDTAVQLEAYSTADNVLTCTLKRPISASSSAKRRDAAKDWTYFVARGTVNTYDRKVLHYHGKTGKTISSKKLNSKLLVNVGGPSLAKITQDLECGRTKGCMYSCELDKTCSYLISWKDMGDKVQFHLATHVSDNGASWAAIGFSSDTGMGDDSVVGCAGDDWGRFLLYNSFNKGETSSIINSNGITLISKTFANGILTCTFDRAKNTSYISPMLFDLDRPWYLLWAKGRAVFSTTGLPNLHEHSSTYSSGRPVSFNETNVIVVVPSTNDEPLVIAHGCLMVGAWIFLASVGLVVARHCKPVWTDLIFSKDIWFQIHRLCMVLVSAATVAGTVCIFVEEKEWSDLDNEDAYLQSHPILGIIVTALVIINPIMALWRPDPTSSKRYIFNWAHWLLGEAAHIIAVVTIFFGVDLYDNAPDGTKYVLWVYVGWQVAVEILLYGVHCCCREDRSESYEMDENGLLATSTVHLVHVDSIRGSKIKGMILVLHFFVVSVIAASVVTLLAQGKQP